MVRKACGVNQMKNNRGVVNRRKARDTSIEEVCLCYCHVESGTLHMMACCHEPKTEDGKMLLATYNAENQVCKNE